MPSLIQDKRGVFYIVSSLNGKRVWRSTRTRNRKEAYRCFLKTEEHHPPKTQKLLAGHIADYIEHVRATFGPKTYKMYELCLRHLLKFTGDVPLDQISARQIDMYKIERLKTVSPSTTNIELKVMRAFFNCLKRWDVIQTSPCAAVSPVRVPKQLPAYLTMEQLEQLTNHIEDPWLRRIVLFAAMTGARLGEVLSLTWDRVNLEEKTVLIESSHTYRVKGGQVRAIPLNSTAVSVLRELRETQGLVFKGKRGGPANPNYVSAHFRRVVRRAGLDRRLHFHSLRHTFASLLVQRGVSLYQVQKLLGHSSPRVTEIYAHLQNPQMHGVVDLIQLRKMEGNKCRQIDPIWIITCPDQKEGRGHEFSQFKA